ncbi:MAG: phosphoribosylglycinamide synthetase C domain-containing protein, partial [Deltaproteobacteria bacterium]
EHCAAAANGDLAGAKVLWKPQDCVTVVLASAGYPASSHKGAVISGLAVAAARDDVTVYHAGTALQDGQVVTAGGRVLAVSALGDGFAAARTRAYEGVGKIGFDGMQARPDIAERAVKARAGELDLFPAGFAG